MIFDPTQLTFGILLVIVIIQVFLILSLIKIYTKQIKELTSKLMCRTHNEYAQYEIAKEKVKKEKKQDIPANPLVKL